MSDIQELKRDQLLAEIGPDVVTAEMLAERVGICTPHRISLRAPIACGWPQDPFGAWLRLPETRARSGGTAMSLAAGRN
ncbi:hypothetical protein CK214_23485 [Mesorhizobium sp. WSM3882]|nr:hypothetical protein CK214_23485 [Mesorhizobium sp. WSM3882]